MKLSPACLFLVLLASCTSEEEERFVAACMGECQNEIAQGCFNEGRQTADDCEEKCEDDFDEMPEDCLDEANELADCRAAHPDLCDPSIEEPVCGDQATVAIACILIESSSVGFLLD